MHSEKPPLVVDGSSAPVPVTGEEEHRALPMGVRWLEQAFDLVAVVTLPKLRLLALNRAGRMLLELGADTRVSSLPWMDLIAPRTLETLFQQAVPAMLAGRSWRGAGVLLRSGDLDLPVRLVCWPTTDERALFTATDDSSAHRMQMVLRHEQTLLHALLNTLPDAIYFKDRDSRFLRGNVAIARRMGVANPGELLGRTDFDFFLEEHARKAFDDEQRIIRTGVPLVDVEEKETWPDGRVTWVSTSKFPLRDSLGGIIGTFGISRDVTERKLAEAARQHLEQQLAQAQKMEAIGRIASGIAHEINTPMQFISDNVRFLGESFMQLASVIGNYEALAAVARGFPAASSAADAADRAAAAVELDYLRIEIPRTVEQTSEGLARIARIVRSLRDYAHPGVAERAPVDLNHVVETAVAVSRHEWKLVAEVVTELDPALPVVLGIADELNQVMLNLIINAAHAVADAVQDGAPGRIKLRTCVDGEWIAVEVADTGSGIAPEVRPHIFEPFITTKAPGRGTGQGLALVHTFVVKHHGGRVDFVTTPGQGTTFTVRLPLRPPSPSTP